MTSVVGEARGAMPKMRGGRRLPRTSTVGPRLGATGVAGRTRRGRGKDRRAAATCRVLGACRVRMARRLQGVHLGCTGAHRGCGGGGGGAHRGYTGVVRWPH